MSDASQIVVPPSFIDLFRSPGQVRPNASRETILERYELCEDLATMLVETAQTRLWELGITEDDVILRIHRGLVDLSGLGGVPGPGAGVSAAEAVWVTRRLAELLGWRVPPLPTIDADGL